MNEKDKNIIAFRMISRVESGFSFIDDHIHRHSTDMAWVRSLYILFSFHLELLIKSYFVLIGTFSNPDDLDEKLRKVGHNFLNVSNYISKEELAEIGITNISKKDAEYLITFEGSGIKVKDFIDIRYDFIEGKVRDLPSNENETIKMFLGLSQKLKQNIKTFLNEDIINDPKNFLTEEQIDKLNNLP